jgi:uncharacterized membrane protein HdeD (DUF308 family)
VIYGALRLAWAFKGGGIGMAVLGILTIAPGILLLLNSLAGAVIFHRVYVFSLGVGGIAALIGGLRMRSDKSSSHAGYRSRTG